MDLLEFLNYVEKTYCSLHATRTTIDHIYDTARIITTHIVNRIGQLNQFLGVKELKSVGSFAEETKIRGPNEFDFVACLDFLSNKENIEIKASEGSAPGFMVVSLKDPQDAMDSFRMNLYGDVCCVEDVGLRQTFIKCLSDVVDGFLHFSVITNYGALVLTGASDVTLHFEWKHFEHTYNGELVNKGFGNHDIPCSLSHRLEVDIDVMPAIDIHDHTLVCSTDGFPEKFTDVIKTQGCHLVCKPIANRKYSPYLQISFATCEVALMQNLHPDHKRCYKLLKYLLTDGTNIEHQLKCICLSSYMIKTALLFHEYEHQCCESPSIHQCMLSIIDYIRQNFRKGIMPSFFMRNVNVWGRAYRTPLRDHWKLNSVRDEDCCRADWSVIMWMELWHQLLSKAIMILKDINTERETGCREKINEINEEENGQVPGKKMNETTKVSSTTISDNDRKFIGNPAIGVPKTHESKNYGLVEYIPTRYDKFIDAFRELRQTMVYVTKELEANVHIRHSLMKTPKEGIWKLVLPHFHEYVAQIEKDCKIKINLSKNELVGSKSIEVIYRRVQEGNV